MTDATIYTAGKLITSHNGRCHGPRYGEVYTAAAGGYMAGYRSHAMPGLALMGIEWFAKLKEAEDYAVSVTDI